MTRPPDLELEKEIMNNDGYNTGFDHDLPTSFVTPYQIGVGLGHFGGSFDALRRPDPISAFEPAIKRTALTKPVLPTPEPPLPTVSVTPRILPLPSHSCDWIGSSRFFLWP